VRFLLPEYASAFNRAKRGGQGPREFACSPAFIVDLIKSGPRSAEPSPAWSGGAAAPAVQGFDKGRGPVGLPPIGQACHLPAWPDQGPRGSSLFCSLRWGELAALRRADLDMAKRTVRISRSLTELPGCGRSYGPPKSAAVRRTVVILTSSPPTWRLISNRSLAPATTIWCSQVLRANRSIMATSADVSGSLRFIESG